MQIYFAAPWFTPEQADIHERVYQTLITSPHKVFSPKHAIKLDTQAPRALRRSAFASNLANIMSADLVVAVTDYKDVGTVFECGYAFRSGKFILYYAETLGTRPFNLMLAESGVSIVRSTQELSNWIYKARSKEDMLDMRAEYEGGVE